MSPELSSGRIRSKLIASITAPVHRAGGRILLQILHAGRYGYHPAVVAPSAVKSPINRDTPAMLSAAQIEETIRNYATTASLAIEAGYDGVEIMGSEGYLISEFLAPRTNQRDDAWGGGLENRARFPLAVVGAVRKAVGDAIISYRISALELIEGGLTDAETVWLAKEIERAGADCLSTGIGWHESTVPTIAGTVPHAAFIEATRRLKKAVSIPVTASNRINLPDDAARVISDGSADLVSMARPFLADADFVNKVRRGRPDLVNICIACNQACLDHYFTGQVISCLVNPRAARESEFTDEPAPRRQARGRASAPALRELPRRWRRRGAGTMSRCSRRPSRSVVNSPWLPSSPARKTTAWRWRALPLNWPKRASMSGPGNRSMQSRCCAENFDDVVISTGVSPRLFDIPGGDDPRVVGYTKILDGSVKAGERVIIIGGGGIGHDVALFVALGEDGKRQTAKAFAERWGLNGAAQAASASPPGDHGEALRGAVRPYAWQEHRLDSPAGAEGSRRSPDLRCDLSPDRRRWPARCAVGSHEVLPADTIIVCAGQESDRGLADELEAGGQKVHVIGGARFAGELDAKRAVNEGAMVGNRL